MQVGHFPAAAAVGSVCFKRAYAPQKTREEAEKTLGTIP